MPRQRKLPAGLWKRGDTYFSRFRAQGKIVRKRLSTDYRTAVELLNEERSRADKADYGLVDNDYSWAKLREEFLRWAKQSIRDPDAYENDLDVFEEFAAIKNVREIDAARIMAFREWRLGQHVTPRTVNKQVGTIRNMLNKAVTWGRIGYNVAKSVKPLRHDAPKKERRALTVDEAQAVFDNSPEFLREIWRFFMVTGVRHDELVSMRFDDIDFERRTVTVRAATSKNHKAREIPLDDEAFATVSRLRDEAPNRQPPDKQRGRPKDAAAILRNQSRDHVFVTPVGTPWRNNLLRSFYRVCKRAGIDDAKRLGSIDLHSLRVTFTTLAIEHGANPKDVQAILGHSTLSLTMNVYSKATERGKRAAVSSIPFAKASAPNHVVSMQNAHTARTSDLELPQLQAAQ